MLRSPHQAVPYLSRMPRKPPQGHTLAPTLTHTREEAPKGVTYAAGFYLPHLQVLHIKLNKGTSHGAGKRFCSQVPAVSSHPLQSVAQLHPAPEKSPFSL